MRRRPPTCAAALACVVLAACSGGGSPPWDAAPDAIDAALVDGAPDAAVSDAAIDGPSVDAAVDGPPIDAATDAAIDAGPPEPCADDPVLTPLHALRFGVGAGVHVPGLADGSFYYCDDAGSLDPMATMHRRTAAGITNNGPLHNHAYCGGMLGLDTERAIMAMSGFLPPRLPRLVVEDFAQHTTSVIALPSPGTDTVAYGLEAIPGGMLASGKVWSPVARDILWELDRDGHVLRTVLDVRSGVVIPSATPPVVIARIVVPDRVELVDLATGAVIGTEVVPMEISQLFVGPRGVVVFGLVGGHVAYVPLGSSVPTVIPELTAQVWVAFDPQGRLLLPLDLGDNLQVALLRFDDQLFDGVDGDSRRDATFGGGSCGRVRVELGAPCLPGDTCPPGAHHPRLWIWPHVDSAGQLVVGASFGLFTPMQYARGYRRYVYP